MARDSSTREYLLFIATALSLRWLGSHRKLTFSVVPSYSGRLEEWGHWRESAWQQSGRRAVRCSRSPLLVGFVSHSKMQLAASHDFSMTNP